MRPEAVESAQMRGASIEKHIWLYTANCMIGLIVPYSGPTAALEEYRDSL